jgi:hypothetical protein
VESRSRDRLLPRERRKRHGKAEAVVEPEPREIRAEAGLQRRDPEIRAQRETQGIADRRALDRGDDRRMGSEQPQRLLVQRSRLPGRVAAGGGTEVGARAEMLTLGAEDDRAAP